MKRPKHYYDPLYPKEGIKAWNLCVDEFKAFLPSLEDIQKILERSRPYYMIEDDSRKIAKAIFNRIQGET